jgi:hypothetical protein
MSLISKPDQMKKTIGCILILYGCVLSNAQQVVSSGGYSLKSEISVDWILGGSLSNLPAYDEITLARLQAEQLMKSEIVLKVYPTPAVDFINIEIAPVDTGRLILKLFDNSGTLVLNQVVAVQPILEVNISDIPSGVYFLKVFLLSNDQTFRTVKIVKTQTKPQ